MVRASRGNALTGTAPLKSDSPSTRRHGLPGRQNVLRCVHITIMLLAALWASPLAATQIQFLQDVPAIRTPLAGRVESIDLAQLTSVPLALVLEHRQEFAEGRIGDRAGKVVVLDHASHVEVLDGDYVETPDKIGGYFVEVVPAGVCNPGVKPSHMESLYRPALRAFRLAGKIVLGPGKTTLGLHQGFRILDLLAGREGSQSRDPEVDTDCLVNRSELLDLLIDAKSDEVSVRRVLDYRDGRGDRLEAPGPADFEPSYAGKCEILISGVPLGRGSRVFSGLIVGLLLETGILGPLLEEVYKGCLEVPECLLGRDAGNLVEPGILRGLLEGGKHGARFVISHRDAVLEVGIGTHPKSPVVDVAAGSEDADQLFLLLVGRIETKTISNLHGDTVYPVNRKVNNKGGDASSHV